MILKFLILVSISRLKIWEFWFQSQYEDSSFKSLDSSLNFQTFDLNFLSTDVSEEDSDTESDYKEKIWSDTKDNLDNVD